MGRGVGREGERGGEGEGEEGKGRGKGGGGKDGGGLQTCPHVTCIPKRRP